MSATHVVRQATRIGYADAKAMYSWSTWTFGIVLRMAAQVLFFALMGLVTESPGFIEFAFIGNVAATVAVMGLGVGPDAAWERYQGTLPLLVAAPSSMFPVFVGRNLFHMADGVGQGLLIFLILAPVLGFDPTVYWLWLPLGLVFVMVGSYGLGLFLSGISIRRPRIGNTLFNIVFWGVVAIAGVNVPTETFPAVVQRLADMLPIRHGLLALREVLESGMSLEVARQAGLELSIGLLWTGLAAIAYRTLAEGGRKDGSINLDE